MNSKMTLIYWKGDKFANSGASYNQGQIRTCYWSVRELGISCTDLAKQLGMGQPGVGYAANRGEKIAKEHKYQLL